MVDRLRGAQRVVPPSQVELQKLIGTRGLVLGRLQVNATHPVAARLEKLDQMMADKAACSGDEHARGGLVPVGGVHQNQSLRVLSSSVAEQGQTLSAVLAANQHDKDGDVLGVAPPQSARLH